MGGGGPSKQKNKYNMEISQNLLNRSHSVPGTQDMYIFSGDSLIDSNQQQRYRHINHIKLFNIIRNET